MLKNCKCTVFSTGSFCQVYRVTDEALIAETAVWPNFFLMNIFFAIKGSKLFIIICQDFMVVLVICKNEEDTYSRYQLPWKKEFQSYLVQNLTQSTPYPRDASDKICLNSACRLRRYLCLKAWTDRLTDRQTNRRRLDWYTLSSPSPGELKIHVS